MRGTAMFNNRELRVKVVKTSKYEDSTEDNSVLAYMDPELMADIVKDLLKHTAIVFGVSIAAGIVLNTVAEVVKTVVESKIK